MDIGSGELLVIVLALLLVLGGSRIPQFARNLGMAKREFEKGRDEAGHDGSTEPDATPEHPAG